jgi:hypothetical protein
LIKDFIPKCDSVIAMIYDAQLSGAPINQRELHYKAIEIIPSTEWSYILQYLLDAEIIHDILDENEEDQYLFKVNDDYITITNNILKAEHIPRTETSF